MGAVDHDKFVLLCDIVRRARLKSVLCANVCTSKLNLGIAHSNRDHDDLTVGGVVSIRVSRIDPVVRDKQAPGIVRRRTLVVTTRVKAALNRCSVGFE